MPVPVRRTSSRPILSRPAPSLAEYGSGEDPRAAWLYLLGGILVLPALLVPFIRSATWVLGAIVHEFGHTAAGWLSGCPSIPRLAPGRYADTLMSRQSLPLALVLCVAVASLPWKAWQRGMRPGVRALALTIALLYPLVIFTGAREIVFHFAGHGFELAFAGVCFWRAITGGFTHSNAERAAYSVCGWALLAVNVGLFGGLMMDVVSRAHYLEGSPSGWPNDLVRVASAWGWSLQAVAGLAMLFALGVLPAAVALAWPGSGRRG